LKKEVKYRLIKHISFLENELKDYGLFKTLTWKEYDEQRTKRRNVERWVENIINSSIDISKIILTFEKKDLPDTYRAIVKNLSLISGFSAENMEKLTEWVGLRNIISHEYLDIRWSSIKSFISETGPLYRQFVVQAKGYLERKILEAEETA
jgi:uncharacterized protein YutE (UPF0331/DUF86 family)